MSGERQEKYTDEPTANLLARLEEIAAERERRAGGLGFADAYEAVRDSLALREIAHRLVEATLALRSAREDSARLRKSLAWLVEYMDDGIDAFSASHDCEFTTNPDRGKCDFCEAWAEAVEVSAVSLPQPERDDDGN